MELNTTLPYQTLPASKELKPLSFASHLLAHFILPCISHNLPF